MALSSFEEDWLQMMLAVRAGDLDRFVRIISRQSPGPEQWEQIEEGLLQIHLFAGYPPMIEGFLHLKKLYPDRSHRADRNHVSEDKQKEKGRQLCREVYGSSFEPMIQAMQDAHPDLARWILRDGYGRVLSRPGLPGRLRELLSVALLADMAYPDQLRSHLEGALRLGGTREDLSEVQRLIEKETDELSESIEEQFHAILHSESSDE